MLLQAALPGCLLLVACENDQGQIRALTDKRVIVDEARQVESLLSQNARLRAKLIAPLMRRYQADTVYVEFPNSLKVDFYDSTGVVESRLSARYGKHFEHLNKVLLRDSVVVYNIKGDTLKTPELWWDQNTQKFYTDKEVVLRTKDKQIYGGRGLEADQDLSRWFIFQPTGILQVEDL